MDACKLSILSLRLLSIPYILLFKKLSTLFNFLVQLSIDAFLLLHKISYHLAQIQNGLLNRRGHGCLLMLCSWGYIYRRLRSPGKVRVTPPVRVVSVSIWSICLWLIFAHHISILKMGVWTWFSCVVNGLAVETIFGLYMAFSHCLNLLDPFSF